MKKTYIYVIAVVAVVLVLVATCGSKHKQFDWGTQRDMPKGDIQPYDMQLFDSLLFRSLPNGYEVVTLPIMDLSDRESDESNDTEYIPVPEIAEISPDTSILIVHSYDWYTHGGSRFDGSDHVNLIFNLARHAQRGGKSILVLPMGSDGYYRVGDDLDAFLYSVDYNPGQEIEWRSYIKGDYSQIPYTGEWILSIEDNTFPVYDKHIDAHDFNLSNRYTYDYFRFTPSPYKYHGEETAVRTYPIIQTVDGVTTYAIDFSFIDSGGHIYVTTLTPYFTNIGLHIPDGENVVAYLMGQIDSRPVVRLQCERYNGEGEAAVGDNAYMSVVSKSKALALALILTMAFALALLARGLMRRYPVSASPDDELDRTDAVAVREHQFHRSPLLHFLYQCSWLYKDEKNYDELFKVNFRRLARTVKRIAGIELKTADDETLKAAARTLAKMQGRDEKDVFDELKWMRDANQLDDIVVNRAQYKYSQEVVERYPFK